MFSGIIAHLGKLHKREGAKLSFKADASLSRKLKKGVSVSVNGACLTVIAVLRKPQNNIFSVQVMPETEKLTMLGGLKIGNLVNLELPMTANTMLSGHLVQGHVDGIGIIQEIRSKGNSRILKISLPSGVGRYVADKGSICVNGISLTVIKAYKLYFTTGIIPYTWSHTMLHKIKVGDRVNIEVDMIAKYVEKLL